MLNCINLVSAGESSQNNCIFGKEENVRWSLLNRRIRSGLSSFMTFRSIRFFHPGNQTKSVLAKSGT